MPTCTGALCMVLSLVATPIPAQSILQEKPRCYPTYWMVDDPDMPVAPHVLEMYPETISKVTVKMYCPEKNMITVKSSVVIDRPKHKRQTENLDECISLTGKPGLCQQVSEQE